MGFAGGAHYSGGQESNVEIASICAVWHFVMALITVNVAEEWEIVDL